jgi:hypothetical protein
MPRVVQIDNAPLSVVAVRAIAGRLRIRGFKGLSNELEVAYE